MVYAIIIVLVLLVAGTDLFGTISNNANTPFSSGGIVGDVWDDFIVRWARIRTNLDTAEIKATIQTESSGNPNASNPNDPSWGLMGITQLIARYYLGKQADDGLWK